MKQIRAFFYKSEMGNEPVREWLLSLSDEDRKTIGDDIRTVEFGWPVGMPVSRPLGDGLFEVRSDLTNGRIARVIFYPSEDLMVLLHGFIKKTPKTPKNDLKIAKERKARLLEEKKNG